VKTATFQVVGKKIQKIFSEGGVTPKNRNFFYKNGCSAKYSGFQIIKLLHGMRACTGDTPVKTGSSGKRDHFCYKHFKKFGFSKKFQNYSIGVP
jgi:hypothetical protein